MQIVLRKALTGALCFGIGPPSLASGGLHG